MKISASDIGWKSEYDEQMYNLMADKGIQGLEIAPTRIFPEDPYSHREQAAKWARALKADFGLAVSSMQSIWYGRNENIFVSKQEREVLLEYTKKAMEFAEAVECKNLVFGCPRNRNVPQGADVSVAEEFFGILGEYALEHNTVLAMEANPPIYNTNYCNNTLQAYELVKRVNSRGFKINLDVGTMIAQQEDETVVHSVMNYINHVHISEPGLVLPQERELHEGIARVLSDNDYDGYISLEVKTQDNSENVKKALEYIANIFG